MSTVQTVTGEIDADELGLTLIHEHFFSSDEAVSAQWPHIRDRQQEHDLAVESAEAVKGHGVRTVVEPTAMLLGRDVQASRELAEETGRVGLLALAQAVPGIEAPRQPADDDDQEQRPHAHPHERTSRPRPVQARHRAAPAAGGRPHETSSRRRRPLHQSTTSTSTSSTYRYVHTSP